MSAKVAVSKLSNTPFKLFAHLNQGLKSRLKDSQSNFKAPARRLVRQPTKKNKLAQLILELRDSNCSKSIAVQIFPLLNLKNSFASYIPSFTQKKVSLDFVRFLISKKYKLPTGTAEFYFSLVLSTTERDLEVIDLLLDYLLTNKIMIHPKEMKEIYLTCIYQALDKDYTLLIMDKLKGLEPLINAKNEELKRYFMKWSWLCTLEELEQVFGISKSSSSSIIENVNSKYFISNPDSYRVNDLLKFKIQTAAKPFDLAKILARSDEMIQANSYLLPGMSETTEPAEIICTISNFDLRKRRHEIKIHQNCEVPSTGVSFLKYGNLSTFKTQLDALITFASKGNSCTDTYNILMDLPLTLPQSPPPQLANYLKPVGLNTSQLQAIEGVLDQPVSLIQGPPGTGKTHTLAKLLKVLSRRHGPGSILVATPTNAAADNVVEYALREGLRVVRTGDMGAVRKDLAPHCLDNLVPNPLSNFGMAISTLRRADVVCTTCSSASNPFLDKIAFRYVIIDEASQLTETSALVPIVKQTKSLILIGDHQQLPPSVGFWAAQKGFSHSLFARLSNTVKPFMLDTQYRSHPLIMQFSSDRFYDGRLLTGVHHSDRQPPTGFPWRTHSKIGQLPVAFVNSQSTEDSSFQEMSKSNSGEARLVIKILTKFLRSGMKESDIGIISPYSGQNRLLRKLLSEQNLSVELNSVDAFQGREKEVIIFSAVRSNKNGSIGFLSDHRRFNVMHTRAKRGLIVIGNRETLTRDTTWKSWLGWIDKLDLEVHL